MASVLVIEDNPVNMKLAVLLLRNSGHTVLCAVDAEMGVILARADQPDLILMDIHLPGMDGLAATTLLKRDPATAAIPVIALTAMTTKADQEKSQIAGCAAYIAKPLRYRELYAAISTILGKVDLQGPLETGLPGVASSPSLRGEAVGAVTAVAVDVRILEGLVGNDPAVILEFLKAFRVSAGKIALELSSSCANGQAVEAGRYAHKIKSSAHIVGALTLSGLCAEMEAAGKADRTATLAALLPRFQQELDAVNAFIDGADHGI